MISFELRIPTEELDFALCVTSGQVFRWRQRADGAWLGMDGDYAYRVVLDQETIRVEGTGTEADFRRLFSLDVDLPQLVQGFLERAPEIAPYASKLSGLRVMSQSCAVETTFAFICTANNHLSRIVPMVEALAAYGESRDGPGGRWTRFPTLEKLAEVSEEELRAKGFGYRGRSIPIAAQEILSRGGEKWLNHLKTLPYEEAHAGMMEITGIGPKVADCICLFALGQHGAVPIDTHVWQAAVRLYFPEWNGASLTETRRREIRRVFHEKFGDHAGWAQQILFFDNLRKQRGKVKESC